MRLPPFRMPMLAFLALVAACATRPPDTQPDAATAEPPFTMIRDQIDQKLASGVHTVVIDNPYGDIQVRKTQSQSIGAALVEQRIGQVPRSAHLDWFIDGARQGLRVRYAEHDPDAPANPRLGRVDLGIFVPDEIGLDLRTDFGSITVRRTGTNVAARSRSGKIVVAASGVLTLESESGEIRAVPLSPQWKGAARISTGGNAVVWVPVRGDIELQVKASDDLFPSFELDHSEQDSEGAWTGHMRRGAGASRLEVSAADVVLMGDAGQ